VLTRLCLMSVRQRLLRGVKLVESALASCGKGLPHSKGFPLSVRYHQPQKTRWPSSVHRVDQLSLLCRPTAVYNPSERSLATPATYALFGGLAAYACYVNNPAALAEADVTVCQALQLSICVVGGHSFDMWFTSNCTDQSNCSFRSHPLYRLSLLHL